MSSQLCSARVLIHSLPCLSTGCIRQMAVPHPLCSSPPRTVRFRRGLHYGGEGAGRMPPFGECPPPQPSTIPLPAGPPIAATPPKEPVISPVRTVLARQIAVGVVPAVELWFAVRAPIDAVIPAVRDAAHLATGHQAEQHHDPQSTENSVHWKIQSRSSGWSRFRPRDDRACHTSIVASTDFAVDCSDCRGTDAGVEENAQTYRQGQRRFPACGV